MALKKSPPAFCAFGSDSLSPAPGKEGGGALASKSIISVPEVVRTSAILSLYFYLAVVFSFDGILVNNANVIRSVPWKMGDGIFMQLFPNKEAMSALMVDGMGWDGMGVMNFGRAMAGN